MRILLITNYFPPEIGAASHLYHELGRALVRRGHEVTVLTGTPRYNVHVRARQGEELAGQTVQDGMTVIRCKVPGLDRTSRIARGLEHLWVAYAFGRAEVGKQDVALVYSPPLTLALTARWHWARRRIPFILNVQDLFPQSAVDLGVLRNPILIRAFETLERRAYWWASVVTVHSSGNAEHVRRQSRGQARVEVMPNWVNTEEIVPGERDNAFRRELRELGIPEDGVLVSFAGTLGYSQDLDIVLDAAARMQGDNVYFAIVGDGVEKDRLERRAASLRLNNVIFLPMQPKDRYPDVLAASDICLATLKPAVRTPVVPSKILSIMAAGRPVVAAMDLSGDAPGLIREAESGVCVGAGDVEGFTEALKRLAADKTLRMAMGQRGRSYAVARLTVDAAAARYEELFEQVVAESRPPRRAYVAVSSVVSAADTESTRRTVSITSGTGEAGSGATTTSAAAETGNTANRAGAVNGGSTAIAASATSATGSATTTGSAGARSTPGTETRTERGRSLGG